MNKWKFAFFLSFIMFCVSTLLVVFMAIDNGTSYTYLEVSYNDQLQANKVLSNLIVKGGQEFSQQDFLHLLRQEYPSAFIVEDGHIIKMDTNTFEFKNDKLIKVR